MKPAPFRLTKEAEAVIRSGLAGAPEGMEPTLVWSPAFESWNKEGKFVGSYEGPMVVLGHYHKHDRPRDSFVDVCGHAVSILPDTLSHLEGKTISCEQVELRPAGENRHAFVLKVG